jgi:ABC-type bacteriocin/lantibiotic exporter with double-glycine peptidase domain
MSRVRELDAREPLSLPAGTAYHVRQGVVLVFAVRLGERRIPICEVSAGGVVTGVDLDRTDLVAYGLPGTCVEPAEAADAEQEVMADAVRQALQRSRVRDDSVVDVMAMQAHHEQRLVDDALLGLVAAVPGERTVAGADWDLPREAAVVGFLAQQIGLRPDPLRLRRAVTDADVSGRDAISALAEAAGASLRRVELPPQWWHREGPALMLWVDGQVAAAVWRRGHYHLWDPQRGVQATVDADLTRQAAVLEPLLNPRKPARLADLLRLGLKGSRNSLGLVLALTVVVALLAAVIPVVTGTLTATIATQTTSTLLVVGIALVALALGDLLVKAVRSYALLRVRGRAVAVTASAVWDRMLRLPMSWHHSSSVTSRMTDANAVDVASMSVPTSAVTALLDVAAVAGALIGVFTVNAWLGLTLVLFLMLRAAVEYRLIKHAASLTREVVDASSASQSVVLQLVRGVNQLRVAGATGRAFARWASTQADATATDVRRRRVNVVQQMAGVVWPTLGLAVLFTITAVSDADVGQLVTAQTALTVSTSALAAAIAAVGAWLSGAAVMKRAEAVMATSPESGIGQEIAELTGAVDLRDIAFRYRQDLPPVLTSLSLSVRSGSHVAIVGPSGCGKSTVLRVLLGLEDPESGIVSYDGRDLTGLDRAAVRRQIGAVMQSSQLLPGSIRDNVDLGRGLTLERIWEALELAAVAEDVRAMPMGVSTTVVEGASTISGGQRQRILLARALAGNPRMLVLDEATSALDNLSQSAIVANLDRLQITRIVVAHRLSTIERADQIIVLGEGSVVQAGTFAELMRDGGALQTLVARQRL